MATQDSFDLTLYARSPIISLASGISLARALLAAVPTGMPAAVKKAAVNLGKITDAAESSWVGRQRVDQALGEVDTKAIDLQTDKSWAALKGRVDSCALLAIADQPLAPRAAELSAMLFADGLGFLKWSYPEQAAMMSVLLRRIDEDRLGRELDAICGPEYLGAVRRLQPLYEAMVAAVLRRKDDGPDLNLQLRALGRALVGYAIRVASTVDADDPKSGDRAGAALRPLDNFRANNPPTARATKPAEPAPTVP